MKRETSKRLKEIRESGEEIYSISRLDCINHCLYEAYRTYKLHDRGKDNAYSREGGVVHDVLEGITKGTHTEADLLPAIQEELDTMDMLGIEFPKGRDGSDVIRDGWVADMEHFAKTYVRPKRRRLVAEEEFLFETPSGHHLVGYIDLQRIYKDGSIDIFDYKTSSLYKGDDLKAHQRQLIVYAMGKEQEGIRVRSCSWIFLKYVEVTFTGYKTVKSKEKSEITKVIERRKIGAELEKHITREMEEKGYDPIDIELVMDKFKASNMVDDLPENIRSNYLVKPYVLKAELTEETRQECLDYIESTIKMWESLGNDERNYPPKSFTKLQKNGKSVPDYFYDTSLCGHFDNCPYIHDYLEQLETMKQGQNDEEDLF